MVKYLFSIVPVFAFISTLNVQETDIPLRLEHFQCYPTLQTDPDVSTTVWLSDQFSTTANGESVRVRGACWFCNPTRKLHNGEVFGIEDVRQHLTFYWTPPANRGPQRTVKIKNQFGDQALRLHEALLLAVPTQKAGYDFVEELDHFKCYRATGNRVRRPQVGLSDQFILPVTRHGVHRPVAFCNPTMKLHGDIFHPIRQSETHLTCYSTTKSDDFIGQTSIRNQFGVHGVLVGTPRVLCVPMRKLGFEAISPDGTEGGSNQPNLPVSRPFRP